MSFLIKRELITNIGFIDSLKDVSWGPYQISFYWDPTNSVELQISGEGSWKDAIMSTEQEEALLKLTDKLSLYLQSHLELGRNIAIYSDGQNIDSKFTFFAYKESEHVGGELTEINKNRIKLFLEQTINKKGQLACRWIRRSINTKMSYEAFFFLILACETSTEDLGGNHPRTNHDELKEILGVALHRELYLKGDKQNIRNKLFHGLDIAEPECQKMCEKIYPKIIDHLSKKFNITIDKIKIPFKNIQYEDGLIPLTFRTQYPNSLIPKDSPSIAELRGWFKSNFPVAQPEPSPPKYIQYAK